MLPVSLIHTSGLAALRLFQRFEPFELFERLELFQIVVTVDHPFYREALLDPVPAVRAIQRLGHGDLALVSTFTTGKRLSEIFWSPQPRTGVHTVAGLSALGSEHRHVGKGVTVDPHDPADILYTSGSTGTPKGVVTSHDAALRTAYASALTRAFEDGRRILFSLPTYHMFGYVEGLLSVLYVGGGVIASDACRRMPLRSASCIAASASSTQTPT